MQSARPGDGMVTKDVRVTVDDVEFAGELNIGGYRKGVFDPGIVWASMAPVITPELRQKVVDAVNGCMSRGYSIGGRTVDGWMKEFVDDFVTEDGRKNTRFHYGCPKCEAEGPGELLTTPDWMLKGFEMALGVPKSAGLSLIVSTTIFLGQRWAGDWKSTGPESSQRTYEGEQFCVFHGVSEYRGMEVMD